MEINFTNYQRILKRRCEIQFVFCVPLFLFYSLASGQQIFVAAGADASGSGGSGSYSVGQTFYKVNSGAATTVAEGVQQAYEISYLGTDNHTAVTMEMKVFPNPSISNIYLKIGDKSLKNLHYQLFDASGRALDHQSIKQEETIIDLSSKASGIYLLVVSTGAEKLKTFKVIKK